MVSTVHFIYTNDLVLLEIKAGENPLVMTALATQDTKKPLLDFSYHVSLFYHSNVTVNVILRKWEQAYIPGFW